jgi:hypothetical protein
VPKYGGTLLGRFEQMNVYYVELDDPGRVGRDTFSASYFFGNEGKPQEGRPRRGKRLDLGFVRLFEGKPEAFLVRVNANTPGQYTFGCMVRLGYKDIEVTQAISGPKTFLFVGERKKRPGPRSALDGGRVRQ